LELKIFVKTGIVVEAGVKLFGLGVESEPKILDYDAYDYL